jgi:hypothetical protein
LSITEESTGAITLNANLILRDGGDVFRLLFATDGGSEEDTHREEVQ